MLSESDAANLERASPAPPPMSSSLLSSPEPAITTGTEMFITEENMGLMENMMDHWSLKGSVLSELRKWRLGAMELHGLELRRERDMHATHTAQLNAHTHSFKELIHTQRRDSQRRSQVMRELTNGVVRQRECMQLTRAFTHWRLRHTQAREEALGGRLAERHYRLRLQRQVWFGWHSLVRVRWKERVERESQERAEKTCQQLYEDHKARMAEVLRALEQAQAEAQGLQGERECYEEAVKKAFMRGVCALNMETLGMFHSGEGPEEHDIPPPCDEAGGCGSVHLQTQTASFAQFSPIPSDFSTLRQLQKPIVIPTGSEMGLSRGAEAEAVTPSRCIGLETVSSRTGSTGSHPPGGATSTLRQQRASRLVSTRITGCSDPRIKVSRHHGNLQVMGSTPPSSAFLVERHFPVPQMVVSQAAAARCGRSPQSSRNSPQTSRKPPSSPRIHTVRVLE